MPVYIKGTNTLLAGTLETLQGVAEVNAINPDGTLEYGGSTEVDWNSQRTLTRGQRMAWVEEASGKVRYLRNDQLENRDE